MPKQKCIPKKEKKKMKKKKKKKEKKEEEGGRLYVASTMQPLCLYVCVCLTEQVWKEIYEGNDTRGRRVKKGGMLRT